VALDLAMPGEGHLAVRQEGRGIGIGGGGVLRVSPVCPAAARGPGEVVEPCRDGLAHAGALIVRPTPDFAHSSWVATRRGLDKPVSSSPPFKTGLAVG